MDDAERIIMQLYRSKVYSVYFYQQLYAVAHDIIWSNVDMKVIYSKAWRYVFSGARVILWKELGEYNDLASVFGGVDKILAGKKFPMNVRALRFAVLNF